MALNMGALQGRIPFEMNYTEGKDGKKSILRATISVQRNYKPEGAQYYPEDLIRFKAFGGTADFIARNFDTGSHIVIDGNIRTDEWEDKESGQKRSETYLNVINASFAGGGAHTEGGGEKKSSAPKTSNAGASKPVSAAGILDRAKAAKKTSPFD